MDLNRSQEHPPQYRPTPMNPGVYRPTGRHDFNPTSMKNLHAINQDPGMDQQQIYRDYPQAGGGLHHSADPFP